MQLTVPPWYCNALYIPRSHSGGEQEDPLLSDPTTLPCQGFLLPQGCQEKAISAVLSHGPLAASRNRQLANGKYCQQGFNVKWLLWNAFSSSPALLLSPSAAFILALSRPEQT